MTKLHKKHIFTLLWSVLFLALAQGTMQAQITDYTGGALDGYQTVYVLNIPVAVDYKQGGPNYTVNNSANPSFNPGLIESVGYYMVLTDNSSNTEWAFASMNPFSTDLRKIGVPTGSSGAFFQQKVNNLYYKSNAASLNNGTINAAAGITLPQGNIEFWPSDYQQGTALPDIGGDGSKYDYNDSNASTSNGYGSMQIHDFTNQTPIISYNNWNNAGQNSCIGIGKNPGEHPDYTFATNAGSFQNRQLGVYVKTLDFDAITDSAQREVVLGEVANMNIVHKYNLTSDGANTKLTHPIDNPQTPMTGMPLARQAFYYELTDTGGNKTYAYTSFDALTNNTSRLGLPTGNTAFQQRVNNMTVASNVNGVTNGTNIATGNVEIWATNYSEGNVIEIPGANGSTFDFGDTMTPGDYCSFQVHNHGAGQTVFALNHWNTNNPDAGIGSNSGAGSPDWTFAGQNNNGFNQNYTSANLYVLAEAAIAPGMANVTNGNEYSIVQGGRLTSQMTANWQANGFQYDIVDNLASMQSSGKLFDRVGYYIEYASDYDSELQYAFVSMDAFTTDITKIGVPTAPSGILWQQAVKNLEVTSNVTPDKGIITSGKFERGYLEFWPTNYSQGKGNVISDGSSAIYDINDTRALDGQHGSMQVHNLDKGETVFGINGFNQAKQYGIGTNPNASPNGNNAQADWTFDDSKKDYKIANIYTMVREADAVLTTIDAKSGIDFYQRSKNNGMASVDISGNIQLATGASVDKIQASSDGVTWVDMMISGNDYSGNIDLAGGWHNVQIRALDANGDVMTTTTTSKIGVGDIFITAGQSNSTNYGDVPLTTKTRNVVALNHMTGEWGIADDPQPITINGAGDGSSRGSTWASFGDALSEMTGVPVGIVSVGWGGTNIGQWNPNNIDTAAEGWDTIAYQGNQMFGRLAFAIDELDGNFTGILWHQGESDAGNSKEYYESALKALIAASREEAGWEVPWGVALASWRPYDGNDPTKGGAIDENIRAAQQAVIDGDPLVLAGPDTDLVDAILRGMNGGNAIHFSEDGSFLFGEIWANTGYAIVNLPEPSTWALMIFGAVFLGGVRWIRRK